MSYTGLTSELGETCVCALQTSEPRILPGMHRINGPDDMRNRNTIASSRGGEGRTQNRFVDVDIKEDVETDST